MNSGELMVQRVKKQYLFLLVGFCLITFFANLRALPTDIMESRNIITAREIVSDGNWLVPTMNGELRLEKPPLPTWVAAAIESVCPDNLAAQRAAAGMMGCMWTLFLFLLVRDFSHREDLAVATVVVFLTCYNAVLMGRSATWDIYCHAFMMGGIYFFTHALYDSNFSEHGEDYGKRKAKLACWRNFLLAGLFMGLSFLSKGPVSFYALLLPYIIALVIMPSPHMKGKWGALAMMIVVMLAVGSWWYIYLLIVHRTEVSMVINKESGAWTNHNVRQWYYYWRFFLEMGVWAVLILAALAVPYWKKHISLKREYLFAITWAIASWVLLSLMPEKKTRYLLPLLAPCSIVVGCLIIHFKQCDKTDKFSHWLYVGNGILIMVIALLVPVLAYRFGVKEGMISMTTEVIVSIVMLLIAGWLIWSTVKFRPMNFIAGIAAIFVFAELFLLPTIGHAFGNPNAHGIATLRTDRRVENLHFYHNANEPLRIELVYEAHRKILPLNLSDSNTVKAALPFALVSHRWAKEEIPPAVLSEVDTVSVGTFDDNKHPKSNRHYTNDFINHVTILKSK